MRVIADTGPIYALMDEDDSWHGKVNGVIEEKRLELFCLQQYFQKYATSPTSI